VVSKCICENEDAQSGLQLGIICKQRKCPPSMVGNCGYYVVVNYWQGVIFHLRSWAWGLYLIVTNWLVTECYVARWTAYPASCPVVTRGYYPRG